MKSGVQYTGFVSLEELERSSGCPSRERLEKGPVAVIECVQEIPCNPCEAACPFGAISVGQPITATPRLDSELCTGCGQCIAPCPGLAIFKVHKHYSEQGALVEFPYEYLPLPEKGDTVPLGGRDGAFVSQGTVLRIRRGKERDKTTIVSVLVPKEHCMTIRTICRKGGAPS